jgi:hypothetical protein
MPMDLDRAKDAFSELKKNLSSSELKAIGTLLKDMITSDEDDFDQVIDPLDKSFLEMKADEEKLKRQKTALTALYRVGKIAIKLALK